MAEQDLLTYWNSRKLITHRRPPKNGNKKLKTCLKDALEYYSTEEIKSSIFNYSVVLKSKSSYFKYKWNAAEFLDRGLEKFMGNPDEVYGTYTDGKVMMEVIEDSTHPDYQQYSKFSMMGEIN